MTEQKWMECTDPGPMLEFLRGKVSDRKFRLFSCACVRRQVWHILDMRGRGAIILSERLAQGQASSTELHSAALTMNTAFHTTHEKTAKAATKAASMTLWATADATRIARHVRDALGRPDRNAARRDQVALLRDIFGNPFHPSAIDPTLLQWNDGIVQRLAQTIYEDRHFEDMPILADALMDAGCHDETILAHCRGAGPHVCGCWVVDLILGKL